MAAPEARIEQTDEGAVVASPGWFVLNMGDCVWIDDSRQAYREVPRNFRQVKAPWHV